MNCPRCNHPQILSNPTCPACHFSGDSQVLEQLSHLKFLLAELESWELISPTQRAELRRRYEKRQRGVEVDLGVRSPPPDAGEARLLRLELGKLNALRKQLPQWGSRGWLAADVRQTLARSLTDKIAQIEEDLIDAPPPPDFVESLKLILQWWEQKRFQIETVERLHQTGQMGDPAYEAAKAQLTTELHDLEIKAGLRSRPRPASAPKKRTTTSQTKTKAPETLPKRQPRRPWTWDRVWETLLSERTLQAILFLGAILLFASAISWVAWNWETFPPVVQVSFLVGVTAVFYGLGYYVRRHMQLHGSGIALSAVGSLLVPLDFYAIYLTKGFPQERWPQMWLLASVVCLGAYLLTTYLAQAAFFGYLVGVALGSLVTAVLNLLHVPTHWWQTGLALVAFALAIASEGLRGRRSKWAILAQPWGHVALAATAPLLIVGLGWGYIAGAGNSGFYLALAINWWLGGFTLSLMAWRYRMRTIALTTALAFPVATWLSQQWLMQQGSGIVSARYALGWAALAPAYIAAGWWLLRRAQKADDGADDGIVRSYGRTVLNVGSLLVVLAAVWSLTAVGVAAVVHLLLAATMLLAARLWQRPRPLWLVSFFLLTATAMWQGARGATPSQLSLPWALLAILHVVAALRLRGVRVRYDAVLYGAAVALAGVAILPPLILVDRALLAYAVANWIGVNGWLAYLAHGKEAPGIAVLLAARRLRRVGPAFFHWLAAAAVLPWVWLLWTNGRPPSAMLALLFNIVAWGLLWLCLRLRRLRWPYGDAWQTVAHLSNVAAVLIGLQHYQQRWLAAVLILVAAFYFAATAVLHSHRRLWLAVGAVVFPVGWLLGWRSVGLGDEALSAALALVVLAYVVAAVLLEHYRDVGRSLTYPLYAVAFVAGALVYWGALQLWAGGNLLWIALGQLLLGASAALYAWQFKEVIPAYFSMWAITFAGGLVVKEFSRGSGRSAALAALLAIAYVLAERGLHWLALHDKQRRWRRAWRLYRRPLLLAGWLVSLGAIGAALVRNLIWLGGGLTRQTWSIVALLLLVGLYALAARLFGKTRFAWLAAALAIVPWTLLADLGWYVGSSPALRWHGLSWMLLVLLLLGSAILLARRLGVGRWSRPPQVVAHLLAPFAVVWSMFFSEVAVWSLALAVGFYITAVWFDYTFGRAKGQPARARFLYPAVFLLPVWSLYLLLRFVPSPSSVTVGLLWLAFSLPALAAGRRLARWQSRYGMPFYLLACTVATVAVALVSPNRPVHIGVLFFNTGLALLATRLFRQPRWLYVAAVTLPWAIAQWMAQAGVYADHYYGWMLILLAGFYLLAAWILRPSLRRYRTPLLVMMFVWGLLGLLYAGSDPVGALVGYSMAAAIYAAAAVWLRQPLILNLAVAIATRAYWLAILQLGISPANRRLALWPGIVVTLLLAQYLDEIWGVEPLPQRLKMDAFPWDTVSLWPAAVWERLRRWWALPLYTVAFMAAMVSALAVWGAGQRTLVLALATAVYTRALFRFRLRGWLLLAAAWAQFTALALISWIGWADTTSQAALAFMPVTLATAAAGLLVERVRGEGSPFRQGQGWMLAGWSRPFYLLLCGNLFLGQLATLDLSGASALVTMANAAVLGVLATAWQLPFLAYGTVVLGFSALAQFLGWLPASDVTWPVALALLAAIYGMVGYGLRYWRREVQALWPRLLLWQRPLLRGGWIISFLSLFLTYMLGLRVMTIAGRLLFDQPLLRSFELPQAQMMVLVFAVLGLFYLAAAVVERWRWLGYLAVFLLLGAWSQWVLLIQDLRELQLYAIPAGVYLLGVGWVEWRIGSRNLARWIDRAALLLLFGSTFWQSFGVWGGFYALLMIIEGLLVVWWGSFRRLRRFLYLGVAAVIVAVAGQIIEPLLALNTFILLLLGGLLVGLGIALERRLENVRLLARDMQSRLEHWE